MRIGNLCVTRKNMRDSLMLPIPYTVSVAQAGSEYCYSQSQKCCWKGETTSKYNSENGGYSGCTRTVCNREAANEICAKFNYAGKTWRLPTPEEAESWSEATLGLGQNGLMLCNHGTYSGLAQCSDAQSLCKGSYSDYCMPRRVFLSEASTSLGNTIGFERGNYSLGTAHKGYGTSVRCVTEMN